MDFTVLRGWAVHYYNLFNLYSDKYTVYIDTEVYPVNIENLGETKMRSVAVYFYDNDGGRLVEQVFYGDELSILKHLERLFYNRIIGRIVGYGIQYLDIPLLILKARKYEMKAILKTLTIATPLDLVIPTSLYFYAKTHEFKLYSLKEVVSMLGLDEKYEFSEDIFNDTEKLVQYNLRDLRNIKKLYDFLYNVYRNTRFVNYLEL